MDLNNYKIGCNETSAIAKDFLGIFFFVMRTSVLAEKEVMGTFLHNEALKVEAGGKSMGAAETRLC